MNETKTTWHKYPDEKPTEEKEYLISYYDYTEKRSEVTLDSYIPEYDCWDTYYDGVYTKVYAWAEKPIPFQLEAKDE